MMELVTRIKNETDYLNQTNITRTKAYLDFYLRYPEIQWAFLASMVSRNAGWNMTDLKTNTYQKILTKKMADHLFMTYERANWLIFSDAYPQLRIYQYSLKHKTPLFHLLNEFSVSCFMYEEWNRFFETKDHYRLMTALIINEQNVIQKPVIEQPYFRRHVFRKLPFLIQELLHLNGVLFPTLQGDVYGLFIKGFTNIDNRINLGKQLASLLFDPELKESFLTFARTVEPDGTRREYEQFLNQEIIGASPLELLYPKVNHQDVYRFDWRMERNVKESWWESVSYQPDTCMKSRFYRKRRRLKQFARVIGKIKNSGQSP